MDYAQEQRKPGKHMVGFGVVILLHVVFIYALMNGLGHKIVKLVQKPLEVKIVEEVAPPPPPETPPPPPPKMDAPPPPTFVPTPEVVVTPPPTATAAPVITTTNVKPAEMPVPRAPAPVAPPAPTHVVASAASCSNFAGAQKDFAAKLSTLAEQENVAPGTKVDIEVEAGVGPDGALTEPVIRKSSNPIFNNLAKQFARRLKCNSGGSKILLPLGFNIED